jgi:hypothetical protein
MHKNNKMYSIIKTIVPDTRFALVTTTQCHVITIYTVILSYFYELFTFYLTEEDDAKSCYLHIILIFQTDKILVHHRRFTVKNMM